MRPPRSAGAASGGGSTQSLLFLVLMVLSLLLTTLVFVLMRLSQASNSAGGGAAGSSSSSRVGPGSGADDAAAARALLAEKNVRYLRNEHAKFIAGLEPWNAHSPVGNFEAYKAPLLEPEGASSSSSSSSSGGVGGSGAGSGTGGTAVERVLVVYTYTDSPWRERNLRYFLRHGIIASLADGTPVDYTFVLHGPPPLTLFREMAVPYQVMVVTEDRRQEAEAEVLIWGQEMEHMPLVRIVLRDNVGFDYCAARMVLANGWAARAGAYTHFVLMNSAVRGPFLPVYARVVLTWVDAFLDQLSASVHLVGTTINCLGSQRSEDTGEFKALHVQAMLMALDVPGLRDISPYLQCYKVASEAVSHGEVAFTQAVLAAGHSVAVLQSSWRGFEVTKASLSGLEVARRCSAVSEDGGGDPSMPGVYLKGDVHPLEVLFIKTNRNFDEETISRWSFIFNNFQREGDSENFEGALV